MVGVDRDGIVTIRMPWQVEKVPDLISPNDKKVIAQEIRAEVSNDGVV
jgi:hypothetical protein